MFHFCWKLNFFLHLISFECKRSKIKNMYRFEVQSIRFEVQKWNICSTRPPYNFHTKNLQFKTPYLLCMLLTIGRVFVFENNNVCVGASNVTHSYIDRTHAYGTFMFSQLTCSTDTIVRDMAHKYFAFLCIFQVSMVLFYTEIVLDINSIEKMKNLL